MTEVNRHQEFWIELFGEETARKLKSIDYLNVRTGWGKATRLNRDTGHGGSALWPVLVNVDRHKLKRLLEKYYPAIPDVKRVAGDPESTRLWQRGWRKRGYIKFAH